MSLLGKITVIKSLLLSKLVHIFIALPNPSPSMIKKIEMLFYKFLWNNRSDLVKRAKITQDYKCDGLRMVDLVSFIRSMKIGWIKRLYWSQQDWTQFIRADLPPIELMLTYGSKKLKRINKTLLNPFWIDVLQAWTYFIELYRPESYEILTDTLWFSDYTKYANEIIKSWDDKGFIFINDLVNPIAGHLLTREEINQKYAIKMTFLCYHSLIRSIPSEIRNRNNYQQLKLPFIPYQIALVSKNMEISRLAYKEFVRTLRSKYNEAQQIWKNKWIRDIGIAYEGSMSDIRAATNNTYIQSFHFRTVSRTVTTNRFLHLIGRSDNSLCTFCSTTTETLMHLFWACPIVQEFIHRLQTKVYELFNITVAFEKRTWFFPILEKQSKLHIMLISLAKIVINKARNKNVRPNVQHFLNILRLEAEKELGSANARDKLNEFNDKWGSAKKVLRLEQ